MWLSCLVLRDLLCLWLWSGHGDSALWCGPIMHMLGCEPTLLARRHDAYRVHAPAPKLVASLMVVGAGDRAPLRSNTHTHTT